MSMKRIIKANELKRKDFYVNYYENQKNPRKNDMLNSKFVDGDFSNYHKENSNDSFVIRISFS